MMLRTICLRNPTPRTSQADSHLLGTGRREMDSTVRTVLLTTVPRFLKAAKSWQPTR